jgi:cellulose synthase/poly-beta-1,6-N-acetylglucosamine synthase-like glycosyltransferase
MEALFLISIIFLIYTYIGYPVLVFLISKIVTRSCDTDQTFEPQISIIITVYNGEQYLEKKIDNILSSNYPLDKLNIIIVSDGSTDNTEEILGRNLDKVTFQIYNKRRGKAACLNDAVQLAETDYIVFADVRQEFDKNTIRELVKPLSDSSIGAVSGELVFVDDNHNPFSKGIDAYWRYEKLIRNSEAKINSVIGVTGAVYSIKKSLYKPIPTGVVLDDVLIPMQVILAGYRVIFNSNAIAYDVPSSDKFNEKRRKIRTLAGNYQLIQLLPALLNPFVNKLFIQFVSHKVFRLLAPFFMISALLSNVILIDAGIAYLSICIVQVILYLSVLLNEKLSLSRMLPFRIVNTFVVLNWYSLLALIEFMKGKKTHLW